MVAALSAGAIPERNHWVRRMAVALTVIVGLYGFIGWAGAGQWLFAGLCLVAQAGANNCSAQAQRAKSREGVGGSFVFMVAAMVGFAIFSALSLEHAWARQNGSETHFDLATAATDPMFWLFVFLAVVEPAMYWAVEAIERAPLKAQKVADDSPPEPLSSNISTLRQTRVMAATAAASLLALGASNRTADALPMTQADARPDAVRDARLTHVPDAPKSRVRSQPKSRDTSLESRKAAARALLVAGGLSNRAIGDQVGLSSKTVDRLAKSMTPLEGEAA